VSLRRLLPSVACLGLLAASGCGTKAPDLTGLTVTVTFPTQLSLDQLELAVWAGSTQVLSSMRRPLTAGAPLASPQSLSIFLPDALADQDVTCTATPFLGQQQAGMMGSASVRLQRHHLVPIEIALAPGGDAGVSPDDADAADAPPFDGGADDAVAFDGGADVAVDAGDASVPSEAGTDVPTSTLKANGAACGANPECESTQCVDGVCCGSVCGSTCESCNQKGAEGTCTPLPPGTRATECVDQLVASCGFDGTCNGNGACRRYAAGAPCKAASCQTTGTFMPASACDGQGACLAPNPVSCAPYLCNSSTPQCRSTCQTGVVGCAGTAVCTNGSCGAKVLKANGDGCVAAGDCTSNHCVDGVCCETVCTGACVACNLAGSAGLCKPVDAGKTDPHAICKDAGAASCKQNGLCNGAGTCALYPATTTCIAGSCAGRAVIGARTCDGAGTCTLATNVDCLPYRCNPATTNCFTACTANAQCSNAPKRTCNNNICQ
jgi:hypothetical protein